MNEYEVKGYMPADDQAAAVEYCSTIAKDCGQDCIFSTSIYTVQS